MSIASAINAIQSSARLETIRAQERYRLRRMVEATDDALNRLEQMNLSGRDRLGRVGPLVAAQLGGIPHAEEIRLSPQARVQDALDAVFELQERLLEQQRLGIPDDAELEAS